MANEVQVQNRRRGGCEVGEVMIVHNDIMMLQGVQDSWFDKVNCV